jgi:hypothetical protein
MKKKYMKPTLQVWNIKKHTLLAGSGLSAGFQSNPGISNSSGSRAFEFDDDYPWDE